MASPHIASNPVASATAGPSTGAAPIASPNSSDVSPARLHIWRVLSMLAALIGVIVTLVVIASSAV
ncbi:MULTISPECIES: hypothetical protein [Gordonia]|jgi:hypothetical protein|uniref:Uncharacterized protein n=1 Tax=Gordonia alkanivorans CGMCC 6845 TaxID=1423140 RepID=W9DBT0_9ACTN|nr:MULTISPECIES: hypothetical protein [Gordonia]AZZ79838.1 hypothetical protein C5O27_00955 [Gordonia alkanivorans]ETA05814.1 hypothetical protein V525_16270 [Gordonia alkanivorans CGMCC 6845]MDH3005828.1 hypothetical protein [Gordonia alkanivorans]MDH3011200.1 hypothetical protein [Gordonia alkanivorans]MDH3016121.1 hypothetical protein [Gordonia alkanivorans]